MDQHAAEFAVLSRLLDEALDRPERERAAWAQGLPPEYDHLKPRLLSLLADGSVPSSFLERLPALEADGEATGDVGAGDAGAGAPRPGDRLGRYELRGLLGLGGMGRVYRAFDPTLAREIAIKSLAQGFRHDPASLRRIEREAQLLATVKHPNVAAIHGFEKIDGAPYLILELIDGDTLAERLGRGPLPPGTAVAVALQIAAALEEVHRRGLVHRDLKPANVKIGPDGHVKVFDFGIAKPVGPDGARTPGGTTGTGVVPGTAPYMSPEQIRGDAIDTRTDVWAFGCLLYEMLSGERAFSGATAPEIMAAVLRDQVRWDRLPPATPPALRRLLGRCLRRELKDRLQAIGDARIELAELGHGGPGEAAAPDGRPARRALLPWAIAAISLLAVLALAVGRLGVGETRAGVARLSLELPDGLVPAGGFAAPFALAPDGRRVALLVLERGIRRLAVRSLERLEVKVLEGTEGAWQPVFSPDGSELAFFADRKLRKVPSGGGPVMTLAEIGVTPRGATWGLDGTIVFAASQSGALSRVPAGGGAVTPLTQLDLGRGESSHRWPQLLPGGRWLLFTTGTDTASFDDARIEALSLESGARRLLVDGGAHGRYAAGRLFYAHAGRLLAAPFDLDTATVGGPPVVVDEIRYDPRNGGAHFAVAGDATLLYGPGRVRPAETHLAWIDGEGGFTRIGGPPRRFREPRVSPDGRRVAVLIGPASDADLWVVDAESATLTRLSYGLSPHHPVWTPDGRGITVGAEVRGRWRLLTLPAAGSGAAATILESDHRVYPNAWDPQGRFLLFEEQRPGTGWDVRRIDVSGGEAAGAPKDLAATPFQERKAALSPDGRLVAFESNELDGVNGVYVAPVADPGAKTRATSTFANWPCWGAAGQLYYWYAAQTRPGDSADAEGIYRLDWRGTGPRGAPDAAALVWPGTRDQSAVAGRLVLGPYSAFDVDRSRAGPRFLVQETSAERLDGPLVNPVLVLGWSGDHRTATRP